MKLLSIAKKWIIIFLFLPILNTAFADDLTVSLCQEMVRVPVNFSKVNWLLNQGATLSCQCKVRQKVQVTAHESVKVNYYSTDIPSLYFEVYNSNESWVETVYVSPLEMALNKEDYTLLRFLIQQGANLNQSLSDGSLPLEFALQNRKKALIDFLISRGARPSIVNLGCPIDMNLTKSMILRGADPYSVKLQCLAANMEDYKSMLSYMPDIDRVRRNLYPHETLIQLPNILQLLLSKGLSPNVVNNEIERKGLIHFAAASGQLETLRLLQRYGVDLNQVDAWGYTPLFYAIKKGQRAIIDELLLNGAAVDVVAYDGVQSPLLLAMNNNQMEVVNKILQLTKDLSISSESPLVMAFDLKQYELASKLIERGSSISEITDKYNAAYFYENQEAFALALKLGVSPDMMLKGKPLLTHAILNDNHALFDLLMLHGADKNIKDETLKTPLFYTMLKRDLEKSLLLIESNTKLDEPIGEENLTYIEYSIESNNLILAHALLKNGVRLDSSMLDSRLMIKAINTENFELFKLLHEHGGMLDCEILFRAIDTNDLDFVKYIVENGVHSKCSFKKQNALEYARASNRNFEIAQYLKAQSKVNFFKTSNKKLQR